MKKIRSGHILIIIVLICTFVYILFFGLRSKNWDSENHASWVPAGNGLEFKKTSMVFNKGSLFKNKQADYNLKNGICIDMYLKPDFQKTPSFDFIVQFYDGAERRGLLIGQWGRSIVIMNGNDYSNRRRTPKIYLPLEPTDTVRHLVIASDYTGTKAFVDGELIRENPKLHLRLPEDRRKLKLIIGSNETVGNAWQGIIYSLALYNGSIDDSGPLLYYSFSEGSGRIIHEETGNGEDLFIPARLHVLKKEILARPTAEAFSRMGTVIDILLNLLGFIPLGVFLYIFAGFKKNVSLKSRVLFTVVVVFVLSLSIEIYQAWIPTRSSSLIDLVLNTLGGLVGIRLVMSFLKQYET